MSVATTRKGYLLRVSKSSGPSNEINPLVASTENSDRMVASVVSSKRYETYTK